MKKLSAIRAAALLALPLMLSSAAYAAESGPSGHGKSDAANWHKAMCLDHYAHTFGKLGYLQARLSITDKQQDAWNQWYQVESDAATKERDACLASPEKASDKPMSLLDQEDRMEKMLQAKLDELHASRPALEGLYKVLSDEQKTELDQAGEWHRSRMHGPEGMERHGGMEPQEQMPPPAPGPDEER